MAYQKTTWQDGATPLSANNMNNIENGIVDLEESISDLDTAKVDKETGKGLSTNDYTTAEKNKLAGIQAGAEVNQNAFSNVKVGSTTIAADGKTDTLELVAGSNVTLTPDATNDKVTIAATDTKYSNATTSEAGLMSAADKTKLDALGFIYAACSGSGTASVSPNAFTSYNFPIPTTIKKTGYRIAVSSIMIYADEENQAGVVLSGFEVVHSSNVPTYLRVRAYNPTSAAKTVNWAESVANIIGFKPY